MEVKPIQRFVTGPGVDFYYNFQCMISLLGSIPLPPWSYGLHTQRNTCTIEVGSNYDNSSSVNILYVLGSFSLCTLILITIQWFISKYFKHNFTTYILQEIIIMFKTSFCTWLYSLQPPCLYLSLLWFNFHSFFVFLYSIFSLILWLRCHLYHSNLPHSTTSCIQFVYSSVRIIQHQKILSV